MQERILLLAYEVCVFQYIYGNLPARCIHWETFSDKFLFGELWGSMCSVSYWFAFIFNKAKDKDKSIFYPWSATTNQRYIGIRAIRLVLE